MKVLHLIDSLSPGGAERMAVNLCNALNESGVEAWLCPTRAEGMLQAQYRYPGQYFFPAKRHFLDFRAFFRLFRFIRSRQIELIHAHSSSIYWATLLKWLSGVRLIWHDHNGSNQRMAKPASRPLWFCSHYFDAVCSVNSQLAAWAQSTLRCPRERIFELPNFADPGAGFARKSPDRVQFNILCLANIRPEKNQLGLVEAFSIAAKQHPELALQLVGDAPDTAYTHHLRQKITALRLENKVSIPGKQSDVSPWLADADIGILASVSEGLPLAVLEYGLAGLPVICTRVGACESLLENGAAGILCNPGDAHQMAEAIQKLLVDNNLREQLGQKLQQRVRQHYSPEAITQKLISIYRQALGHTGNSLQQA